MSAEKINWPQKSREMHSNHFDSTIWNEFAFRPDDIIIATVHRQRLWHRFEIVA